MQLRPYQIECDEAVVRARSGGGSPLAVLPTGSGKTVIFANRAVVDARANQRTIILAHKVDLIEQTAGKLVAVEPMADVGWIWRDRREYHRPIVVASRDSLAGRLDELGHYDHCVVDEAHHATCKSYRGIVDALRGRNPRITLVGYTATPRMANGRPLITDGLFSEVAYERDLSWGIREGHLCPLRVLEVRTSADGSVLRIGRSGDYTRESLHLLDTDERNGIVVDAWLEHAAGQPTVAFCLDIRHAERLAAAFAARGIASAYASSRGWGTYRAGATSAEPSDAASVRSGSQMGTHAVVCNPILLGEGTDWPWLECGILARPTSQRATYQVVQQMGRVARLSAGKAEGLILSVVDVGAHNLASASQALSGATPDEAPQKKARANAPSEEAARAREEAASRREGLVWSVAEVRLRLSQASLALDGRASTPRSLPRIAWVDVSPLADVPPDTRWAASLDDRQGTLVLYRSGDTWIVVLHTQADGEEALVTLGTGAHPEAAASAARAAGARLDLRYNPGAFWRRNAPTESQLWGLAQRWIDSGRNRWDAKRVASEVADGRTCADVSAWLGYRHVARYWAQRRAE